MSYFVLGVLLFLFNAIDIKVRDRQTEQKENIVPVVCSIISVELAYQ